MASMLNSPSVIAAPVVSQSEIEAFHAEHFSNAAVELFASDFLQPQPNQDDQYYEEDYEYYEEEDDGLGYYPDGVKRTLTDEQIAIFRHSELEALRRAEDKKPAPGTRKPIEVGDAHEVSDATRETNLPDAEALEDGEEGEIESDTPKPSMNAPKKKKKKNKSKKNRQSGASSDPQRGDPSWFKKTVKPDLRKRTWDVVETGMDSLDYDELEGSAGPNAGQTAQRRKISYDD